MWTVSMALMALSGIAASAADPVTIGLVIRHGSPVPDAVRASFEQQTERGLGQIMAERSFSVTWRGEGETARGEAWDRLIDVRTHRAIRTIHQKIPVDKDGYLLDSIL